MCGFHKHHHHHSSFQGMFIHEHGERFPFSEARQDVQHAFNFRSRETCQSQCPLCKNHCPLSSVSCPKGKAYRNNLYTRQGAQMENEPTMSMDTIRLTNSETTTGTTNDSPHNEILASLFHRAVRFMMRAHHHQGHAEHAQMRVLAILKSHESISQRELLEMLHVRSASLSELLGKLEHRNLICRIRDDQDRRNIIITLTEEGSAAAATMESARRQSTDAIFAALSEDERDQLADLLRKVIVSLEQHAADHHSQHNHGDDEPRRGHRQHERGRHGFRGRGGRPHGGRGRGSDEG